MVAVLKGAKEEVRRGLSNSPQHGRDRHSAVLSTAVTHGAREGTRMGTSGRPLREYLGAGPREFLKITERYFGGGGSGG